MELVKQGDLQELIQALRYVMLLVGVREANLPSREERAVLLNYIQTYYAGHTAKEIRLAFEMAIAGKLGEVKVETYENFSVEYFTRIMNAYRSWSSVAYRQFIKPEPIETPQPPRWQIEAEYCFVRLAEMDAHIKPPLRNLLTKKGLLV